MVGVVGVGWSGVAAGWAWGAAGWAWDAVGWAWDAVGWHHTSHLGFAGYVNGESRHLESYIG